MLYSQKYIGVAVILLCTGFNSLSAQKLERDYIRRGNRAFKDSAFVDAEVNYRKALEANPKSTISMFNLGNTLAAQNKVKDALEQYVTAGKIEKEKDHLAQIFHNMGVIFQSQKDYAKAVDAYKESLRSNPSDEETRYNLALAQKLLKDQQQNQEKQDQNQQNQEQQNQEKQKEAKDKNQEQPPQSDKNKDQMSKENAEQLLNSVMQDEKGVQDKVKKQQVIQGGRLEKDW